MPQSLGPNFFFLKALLKKTNTDLTSETLNKELEFLSNLKKA